MRLLVVLAIALCVLAELHPLVCEAGFRNELVAAEYGRSRVQPSISFGENAKSLMMVAVTVLGGLILLVAFYQVVMDAISMRKIMRKLVVDAIDDDQQTTAVNSDEEQANKGEHFDQR